jgi:hypothetical protein
MPNFWHYELQGKSMKKVDPSPNRAIDRDARKRSALPGARHRGR